MLRIIKLLSDGQFHSGEAIGKALNLTRSAVWKLVKQLSQWDIEVISQTGKGYQIKDGLNLLDIEAIKTQIEPDLIHQLPEIELFLSLPSTNDYLLSKKDSDFKNAICLAELLTKGRGRYNRQWISPFAKNIALSILWHFPKDQSELSGLSLSIAIALHKVLQKYIPSKKLGVKWPNDLLYDNKKLAGILIDVQGETHSMTRTVIGIGVNIAIPYKYNEKISQPWTNLETIIQQKVDRNLVVSSLLNEVLKTLILFQKEGLKPYVDYWKQNDLTFNKTITFTTQNGILKGKSLGINEQGHLLIEDLDSRTIKSFSSGELSIIKRDEMDNANEIDHTLEVN